MPIFGHNCVGHLMPPTNTLHNMKNQSKTVVLQRFIRSTWLYWSRLTLHQSDPSSSPPVTSPTTAVFILLPAWFRCCLLLPFVVDRNVHNTSTLVSLVPYVINPTLAFCLNFNACNNTFLYPFTTPKV